MDSLAPETPLIKIHYRFLITKHLTLSRKDDKLKLELRTIFGRNVNGMWRIALRNIGRNRRRTMLTASAVTVAVAILVFAMSYLKGLTADIFQKVIQLQTGHGIITTPDYLKRELMRPLTPSIPEVTELCDTLKTLPQIIAAAPRINFWGFIEVGDVSQVNPQSGIAVDFVKERDILRPEELLVLGRIPTPGSYEMLIGESLRQEIGADVGDTVWVWTATAHHSLYALNFLVAGSFSTGMNVMDKRTFFIPIESAWDLLDMNDRASEVLVMTDDLWKSESVMQTIQRRFPEWHHQTMVATHWSKTGGIIQAMTQVDTMLWFLILIFMVIAGSTITNTMLMAVLERDKEIGMMKALGVRNGSIVVMVVMEAMMIGVLGGLIGGAVGSAMSLWTEAVGIHLGKAMANVDLPIGNALYPDFKWTYLVISMALGIGFSGLAGLYPAWKASKFPAAVTMRRG
jgi:putative ABC transport system permease protein